MHDLVTRAVAKYNRGVRSSDVYLQALEEGIDDLDDLGITRALLSLAATGHLKVIGVARGNEGRNLYLPLDVDPQWHRPQQPLTLGDWVVRAFWELWNSREAQVRSGHRIKPISTEEISAWVGLHRKFSARGITNALTHLAASDQPPLRAVRKGQGRTRLWAPAGLSDDSLALEAPESDLDRVVLAVRGTSARLGRAVSCAEVKEELIKNHSLRLEGSEPAFKILNRLVRVPSADGVYRLFSAGHLRGRVHYCASEALDARAGIQLEQFEGRWNANLTQQRFHAITQCTLPSVAYGRALLLAGSLDAVTTRIKLLGVMLSQSSIHLRRARRLQDVMTQAGQEVNDWIKSQPSELSSSLPNAASTDGVGWTTRELMQGVARIYHRAGSVQDPHTFTRTVGKTFPRLRSELVEHWNQPRQPGIVPLYDRTSALILAATHWGGYEAALQASLAATELGELRDPRFVAAALRQGETDQLYFAIACAAFLWSAECTRELLRLARENPDMGIREAAAWAYGFAGGGDSFKLLDETLACTSPLGASRRSQAEEGGSWWHM